MQNPKEAPASLKAPLDCLEPLVNAPVARVMAHGAAKYGYRNYTVTPCKIRTYIGAIQRHLDAIKMCEDIDPDSGESHWAHIIAGASVWLACDLSGQGIDDRAAVATPLSDRVHIDGDQGSKALTAEFNRGVDELVEELRAQSAGCRIEKGPCSHTACWNNEALDFATRTDPLEPIRRPI